MTTTPAMPGSRRTTTDPEDESLRINCGSSTYGCRQTDADSNSAGSAVSGLDAAVPEQREQQPHANRQRAKAEHEQGEATEGRKGPETGPRDDTKERGRP